MIRFLKNASVPVLKSKLTFIYILNALDIIFTFGLLKTGLFTEMNILMINVVDSALLSIFIKLIIPAMLMIYILCKLEEFPEERLPLCNIAVNFVLVVYSFLTLLHIVYTSLYIYTIL